MLRQETRHTGLLATAFLGLALALPVGLAPAQAQASAAAQAVADHFSGVKSMTGDFMQFDPNGKQTEGKFYIERPGKIRFDYSGAPLRVIADGEQVAINNRKLNTWDLYPLSKTPLKLLLGQSIDLSAANIQSVKEEPDLTTIVMGDKSVFGDSRITMMFDPTTFDLRQWTIRDNQGKDTSVMVYNTRSGVAFDQSMFTIPYTSIAAGQTGN
ncbi:outer membrane lipoprotein carrier protein LolA [Aureimonas glaciei]|uniref:Outer-membrane lipoprotein carrier protein n=1 Tax=Aureimonas glaciei TaxID=1776957 RepID=A0A916YDJ7_9HYPH|nr:outer membrane lipoprotein carrier protein LolA [Aureimonas glaciei]GGD41049.1 outer-membrane lipoprotein carrier protein [Aureimonas glaciei]